MLAVVVSVYTLTMGRWVLVLVAVWLGACAGCASSSPSAGRGRYYMDEPPEPDNVPGAAYTGYGFYNRKAVPDRRDAKPWEFYYKHCSQSGEVFPRSFECSGPFY